MELIEGTCDDCKHPNSDGYCEWGEDCGDYVFWEKIEILK